MSLQTGETVQFKFPKKPDIDYPYDVARAVVGWAEQNLPFDICSNYRPEQALKGKFLNCYGVSRGIAQLAKAWDLPAAISLDKHHAMPFVKIGETVLGIEMTTIKPEIYTLRQAAGNVMLFGYDQLASLYEENIPKKLGQGPFSMYFTPEISDDNDYAWRMRHSDDINTHANLTAVQDVHIITDADQGDDMLNAIGDLTLYRRTGNQERFDEMLPELSSFIPDFMDLQTLGDNKEQ